MSKIAFGVQNAFSRVPFSGNPAATILTEAPLDDSLMHAIAAEIGCPATSFVVRREGEIRVRWFTPTGREIALCGHGAIAATHRLYELFPEFPDRLTLRAPSNEVFVGKMPDGSIQLSLPLRAVAKVATDTPLVRAALANDAQFAALYKGRDYIALFASLEQVKALTPVASRLDALDAYALVAVAPSDGPDCDYVCRFFKSDKPGAEDIANGACQSYVAPLMAKLLGRRSLCLKYLSARGGEMSVEVEGEAVQIRAPCITAIAGTLHLDGVCRMENKVGTGFSNRN